MLKASEQLSEDRQSSRFPFSFSASSVTQLLAALACFLGAFVLPANYPELGRVTRSILMVAGTVSLVLGIGNILFGRYLTQLLVRFGMRSRVVIPREGMVYLGIMLMLAIGALLGHQNTLLLVFGLMAGPFVLNGWAVYAMLKGVSVERQAPRRTTVGEFITVEIRVRNRKRLLASRLLEVRDAVSGTALRQERRHFEGAVTFLRVPSDSERVGRYQLCFDRRGSYRLGPLRVSSRFPLGIGERGNTWSVYSSLLVWPAIGRLKSAWRRQQQELAESDQQRHARVGIFSDQFHRIREYRADDNPRAIHWRSTAKRGELMVREFEQTRQHDVYVLLDLCEQPGFGTAEQELAICLAATICADPLRTMSGGQYLLGVAGSRLEVVAARAAGPFRESALDALATAQICRSARLESLITEVLQSGVASGRGILITPRPDFARLVIPALSAELLPEGVSLMSQLTIVTATRAGLHEVFEPPESAERARPRSQTTGTRTAAQQGAVT